MFLFKGARAAARNSICLAALVAGTAAHADVTAQQVWDNWKSYLGIYGPNSLSVGSEQMSGNTLSITGASIQSAMTTGSMQVDLGDITMTENGDGTVSIAMAPSYPVKISSTMPDGTAQEIDATVSQSGLKMLVSGTPDAMSYALSADRYGVKIDSIVEGGQKQPAEIVVNLNSLSGTYVSNAGDLPDITYDLTAGSLDLLVDANDPAGPGTVTISGQIKDIATQAAVTMPANADMNNPQTLFVDGFSVKGGYTYGAGNYLIATKDMPEAMNGTVTVAGGKLDVEMSKDGFRYDTDSTGIAMNLTSAQIPFPIDVNLGELGLGVAMPLSKTDAPAPFRAAIKIADLSVNDQIWSMIDPQGQLSHDPATARMALSGTARLFFDLLDPSTQEELASAKAPGEINSLSLDDLKLAIAGAILTGTGSFTFDNSDTTTFDGMPAPTGEVNLDLTGGNALIDKLVSMGLVPADQASMGRMMMGMFAKVVGDDHLTSKIEVKGDGSVIANGQRIR